MWSSWEQTVLIFTAAVLEGAVGFDFGLVATPALGTFFGVRDAVILLSLPNMALAVLRALGAGRIASIQILRIMPYIGAGGIGTAAGVLVLLSTPPTPLKWMAGIFVLLCGIYSISRLRLRVDLRDEALFSYILGFASGGFTSLTYAGSPLTVIFLDSLGLQPRQVARLAHVCALVFAAVLVAALSGASALDLPSGARSALGVPPALIGFLVGRVLRGRFSPRLGYIAGLTLTIAAAVTLIAFGPSGWN